MIAHLFKSASGRFHFSGYNACGDPFEGAGFRSTRKPRPFDAVVDVGRDFILVEPEGHLYITGPGPQQFTTWTPGELVAAAKRGWFGFRIQEIDRETVHQVVGTHQGRSRILSPQT